MLDFAPKYREKLLAIFFEAFPIGIYRSYQHRIITITPSKRSKCVSQIVLYCGPHNRVTFAGDFL